MLISELCLWRAMFILRGFFTQLSNPLKKFQLDGLKAETAFCFVEDWSSLLILSFCTFVLTISASKLDLLEDQELSQELQAFAFWFSESIWAGRSGRKFLIFCLCIYTTILGFFQRPFWSAEQHKAEIFFAMTVQSCSISVNVLFRLQMYAWYLVHLRQFWPHLHIGVLWTFINTCNHHTGLWALH